VADIFDLVDLPSWLQIPEVDTETATRVRRFASGWLMQATGLSTWPTPVPDDLWAYAIELAAIAYYNPSGLSSESLDDHNVAYSAERRKEILAAAKATYNTGSGSPQYNFPAWDWTWVATPASDPLTN
jgi:hypothetical protein